MYAALPSPSATIGMHVTDASSALEFSEMPLR